MYGCRKVFLTFVISQLGVASLHASEKTESPPAKKTKLDTTLHVEVTGKGTPVLLIHGFGLSGYSWRHVTKAIARNHTVIVVDLKGCGKSPKPLDGTYSLDDHVKLVHELVVKNDLKNLIIAGHSMGGGIALRVTMKLLDDPEQHGNIAGLILIDSMAYRQELPWFISSLQSPLLRVLGDAAFSPEAQVRSVLQTSYYRVSRITEAQVSTYAKPLKTAGGKHAMIKTAEQIVPKDIDSLIAKYPTITVPALIVWGRFDRVVPLKLGELLDNALPNSRLVVVGDCGHIPHEENPEETVNAISEFLTSRRMAFRRD